MSNETVNTIVENYLKAALWTTPVMVSEFDDSDEFGYLDEYADVYDLADTQLMANARETVINFLDLIGEDALNEYLERYNPEQMGYDLLLTRNRHGAGFQDRYLSYELITKLVDMAHSFGEYDVEHYVDNDPSEFPLDDDRFIHIV